jgi:TonB family protein
VSDPQLLKQVRPNYTPGGLRAKIQGLVELEAIVLANGVVGDVRVTKSLDKVFGLDDEAVIAAKKWLFKPGSIKGVAVPTVVTLILEFRLSRNQPPQTEAPAAPTAPADDFLKGVARDTDPGVTEPKLLQEFRPNYTREAMKEKIQGMVEIDAVVGPDGKIARARVVKSLDKAYGLDEEALKAVYRYRFEPGTLNGKPVPFLVTIVQEFRLH